MDYDKNDFAINIQGVWNQPVTAHLRNDPAAWDARPQLGLQQRAAARPWISPSGVVHGVAVRFMLERALTATTGCQQEAHRRSIW